MVPSIKRMNPNNRRSHHRQQQQIQNGIAPQHEVLSNGSSYQVEQGADSITMTRRPLIPRETNTVQSLSSPTKNPPPVSSDSVMPPTEPISSSSAKGIAMDPFGIEQFLPSLAPPTSPRSGGGGRGRRKAPPSYHNSNDHANTNTNIGVVPPVVDPEQHTPRNSRRSRGGHHHRASSPQKQEEVEINYDAKKHVQAFFKAFGDTFEPRMKNVVETSMSRQSVALKGTIARHEEEVRDLVRKHDDRMTQVIARHKDDMATALMRAEGHMEEHLSAQTYEAAMVLYEKEMQDYIRKRATGRMLFWAALFGIIVITAVFNLEILHGHLGGILGFSISAGYMYLSYRKAVPIPPRRPCRYPSIQGPWTPLQDQDGYNREPQKPWYMDLRRYVPWNREPAAYGLFD